MSTTATLQISQRGVITIPKSLREAYGLRPGDTLTLIDLGGVFVLNPHRSEIDALADKIKAQWDEDGVTLEALLRALEEERERGEG
ncbi:MAG TPA: AbrB/MazE/SpoVT family DNA-binding domain-containing protein [Anaerolineae bacterium]|nr:AbrB/MazE/SpoVT family DNA-binding domain-containing protein [Anaerolineae bacterium]